MNAWSRISYRLYVVLGFAGVIAAVVLTATASGDPGSRTPLHVGLGAVGIYLLGILLFQWLILRDQGWVRRPGETRRDAELLPQGRDALIDALAIDPDGGAGRRRAGASISTGITLHMAGLTLLVLAILGGAAAYEVGEVDTAVSPFGADGITIPLVFLPALLIVGVWALLVPMTIRWGVRAQDAWLQPLGLRTSGMPGSVVLPDATGGLDHHVVGATTMSGVRHGRPVVVTMTARESRVHLAVEAPSARGSAHEGRLRVDEGDLDGTLAAALPGADDRWRRVELAAGPEGITVRRRTSQGEALEARWLEDLWLAERLADALARRTSVHIA